MLKTFLEKIRQQQPLIGLFRSTQAFHRKKTVGFNGIRTQIRMTNLYTGRQLTTY